MTLTASFQMSDALCVGPSGYEWFSACAIYPAVQWHLTLYLGINLTDNGQQHALFHIKTLSALSQLPWFRHGSMPNWLRERLIKDMSMEQERNIRQLIYQLLLNASHEPLVLSSSPLLNISMNVVVNSRVYFSKIFYERLTLIFSGIFCAFSFPRAAWEFIQKRM